MVFLATVAPAVPTLVTTDRCFKLETVPCLPCRQAKTRSSGGGSAREHDALQDILRWSVGRFAKLTDVVGELTTYLATVSELDAAGKQRVEDMLKKLREMSNAVVGLGASHRFVADETARDQKTELKHLENLVWQVSGSGKGVNTSLKELVTGVGRVLGQIDGQLSRNAKTMEENGKHVAAVVEKLVKIETGIQALVQKATFSRSGSGGTPATESGEECVSSTPSTSWANYSSGASTANSAWLQGTHRHTAKLELVYNLLNLGISHTGHKESFQSLPVGLLPPGSFLAGDDVCCQLSH